ncbi:hypothetical protein SBA1_90085 [Candidatus Sulfotelmatobacter kueseliae]|uniref:Uncharacterized protein n=1 Tax=Candidatus Sulfotelmatobacter kueseliae TaxID=2042962 RepID=A0A2U3LAM7_9BACT|nr:hypothetical protein SBA1_90085 [Candidatus Sulfotelmatobacter kueseliae]
MVAEKHSAVFPEFSALKWACENYSFAPPGLAHFPFLPTACAPSTGSGQAVGCILTALRG